jgi:enoyl-CoA hydratase
VIDLDEIDGVAVVRLAHGKVNALDLELLDRITATFTDLDAGRATAIVLTGTGRAFSAGVDLWRIVEGGDDYVRAFLPALDAAFRAVFTCGKPVVAGLNGHAIAGGAILAAACDHRIMAGGTIGVTELLVGVPFPPTALEILRHAYGERAARRAVLTGATHPPAEALAAGYVDEVTALAALTRVNLLVLLAIAGYHGMRQSWRTGLPVVLAAGLVLAGFMITRDPNPAGGTAVSAVGHQLGLDFSKRHFVALLIAYLTTTPLLVALLARRHLAGSTLLWVWLLVPIPVIAYIQVAPKYLLPSLPAVAVLAAHGLDRFAVRTALLALITVAGTILGVLILTADARMAGAARTAAARLIRPRTEAGQRVWFAGHWGFHWYAEEAGAMALTVHPPFPSRGDIVVESTVDRPVGLLPTLPRTLIESWGSSAPTGQVMSRPANAGFFSDLWGLLPWSWGPPDGSGFHVWRVAR